VSRLVCPRPLYHSLSQTFVKQERDARAAPSQIVPSQAA